MSMTASKKRMDDLNSQLNLAEAEVAKCRERLESSVADRDLAEEKKWSAAQACAGDRKKSNMSALSEFAMALDIAEGSVRTASQQLHEAEEREREIRSLVASAEVFLDPGMVDNWVKKRNKLAETANASLFQFVQDLESLHAYEATDFGSIYFSRTSGIGRSVHEQEAMLMAAFVIKTIESNVSPLPPVSHWASILKSNLNSLDEPWTEILQGLQATRSERMGDVLKARADQDWNSGSIRSHLKRRHVFKASGMKNTDGSPRRDIAY